MTIHRTWHTLININNMKFQLIVPRFVNFLHIRFCELQKASGITPWKKCCSLRWPTYYRMCSTDVYCSKQTGGSSTKGNHHPSFLRFWNWARKLSMQPKFCGGAENVVIQTETQQTFVNGLLGFINWAFILRWKRVCIAHNNCMSCPSIWATLSTLTH